MESMKIKFFSDYTDSENLLDNFLAKYHVLDHLLSYTLEDDYDYAVVFNRTNETLRKHAKIITIIQEPSWSIVHQDTTYLENSDYLVIHDPGLFENKLGIRLGGKVLESPSYMFYYDPVGRNYFDGLEKIKKERKLSMIVSGLSFNIGNYGNRLALLNKILNTDLDIDIYGRGLNIADQRYKGVVEYKSNALVPYQYSIAIENSNEKNYITEKFIDCVLCNTVPIYNGAPNIAEVYNERYFKTIDLDSPHIISDIREIIKEPTQPSTVNKEIYLTAFNLYKKLTEIICPDH